MGYIQYRAKCHSSSKNNDPICVTYLASNDHVKLQCVENTVKCLEAVGDSMIQQSALENALIHVFTCPCSILCQGLERIY